jgi:hypothetical protein
MLPESQNLPPRGSKRALGATIPSYVAFKLRAPELRIRDGCGVMLRASVPEAPVDEHRQPSRREDYVGTSWDTGVQAVAATACPQGFTQTHLGSGVATPHACHLLGLRQATALCGT